jgi:predicted transcriptional regulator
MQQISISARIPETLACQVDALVQALGRNRSWAVAESLKAWIASEQQFLESVQIGMADVEAGRTLPNEAMREEIRHRQKPQA